MKLREYFENGMAVEAYEGLLSEDQEKLHALHQRQATITPEDIEIVHASRAHRVLVITEPWCGDSLAIFPVVSSLFKQANCEIRVAQRDLHPELIDQFLTNGGRAIPIVVVLDEADEQILRWGPRPAPAQQTVVNHLEDVKAGRMEKADVHKKIRAFYSSDRGSTIVAEIVGGIVEVSRG